MKDAGIQNTAQSPLSWLLVSGAPRSGTTLLQNVLNSHPEIACLHEFGLDRLVRIADQLFEVEDAQRDLESLYNRGTPDCLAPASGARQSLAPSQFQSIDDFLALRSDRVREVIGDETPVPRREDSERIYRSLFTAISGKQSLRIVADKAPKISDLELITYFEEKLGSLKRIYLVRDPIATIRSSLRRTRNTARGSDRWHVNTVGEAITEWVENWEHIAREAKQTDKVLILRYEDIVSDFRREAARIARFCGVEDRFQDLSSSAPPELSDFELSVSQRAAIEQQLGLLATDWHRMSLNDALEKFAQIVVTVETEQSIEAADREFSALIFREGFGAAEDWGRWTVRHEARFVFKIAGTGNADVWVELKLSSHPFLRGRSQVLVTVNDGPPQLLHIPASGDTTTYAGFLCRANEGRIDCTVWMPHIKGSQDEPIVDSRALGLGFVSITPRVLPGVSTSRSS